MDLDIFPALSVFTNLNAISFRWILSAQVNEYSERQIYFLPPPPPFFREITRVSKINFVKIERVHCC